MTSNKYGFYDYAKHYRLKFTSFRSEAPSCALDNNDFMGFLDSVLEGEGSERQTVGKVIRFGDGIAMVKGLYDVMSGELVEIDAGDRGCFLGIALNLEEDCVGVVMLGGKGSGEFDLSAVREGCIARTTGKVAEVSVGEKFLGRVVNALGYPIDGVEELAWDNAESFSRLVESPAPGIIDRQSVCEPLETGVVAIDALIPIGRGQRELIIGDRQTGKTAIVVDAIVSQVESSVICVYVAIGQKASSVSSVIALLDKSVDVGGGVGGGGGVRPLEYTVVVAANADSPAPLQYLAPYSGTCLAGYFMFNECAATLAIYDDLTKHASAYRQISLLLRRPPGREAYPGDVFYLHSRLLERAAKLLWAGPKSGGSLTALPIVETKAGDVSAYIPTNVISITDGQVFLSAELFNAGIRPAINIGISVSRVGSEAQIPLMKHVVGDLKLRLAQFVELESFSKFSSDLDSKTRELLARGERLREILKQRAGRPIRVADQICLIRAGMGGYFDEVALSEVARVGDQAMRGLSCLFPAFSYSVSLMGLGSSRLAAYDPDGRTITPLLTALTDTKRCASFLEEYLQWFSPLLTQSTTQQP